MFKCKFVAVVVGDADAVGCTPPLVVGVGPDVGDTVGPLVGETVGPNVGATVGLLLIVGPSMVGEETGVPVFSPGLRTVIYLPHCPQRIARSY